MLSLQELMLLLKTYFQVAQNGFPGIKINFYWLVTNWATREKKVVAQTKS
jgi:hypothetical protein